MVEVRFDDVTKGFGDGAVAVDALDLEVADGELMVLVGPSGCGKSTALRMVAGLETRPRARSRSATATSTGLSPAARDIAMVFQNYALYPHMTVREEPRLPAASGGGCRRREIGAARGRGGRRCSS